MKKTQKGFTPVVILIGLLLILVAASAGSYYLLNYSKRPVSTNATPYVPLSTPSPDPNELTISNSDEIKDMEAELNNTQIESVDADFSSLESSASSL